MHYVDPARKITSAGQDLDDLDHDLTDLSARRVKPSRKSVQKYRHHLARLWYISRCKFGGIPLWQQAVLHTGTPMCGRYCKEIVM